MVLELQVEDVLLGGVQLLDISETTCKLKCKTCLFLITQGEGSSTGDVCRYAVSASAFAHCSIALSPAVQPRTDIHR